LKAGALLQVWRHTTQSAGGALILPDGCVDLIGYQPPGERPRWKLSSLVDRARQVPSPAGQRCTGYRLQRLARLRHAARALGGCEPLAHVAADHGFADQAHMNLEFQRWLGFTPAQVQRQTWLQDLLNEAGTGEEHPCAMVLAAR
jgi:AraC-like DNA-binding protein